MDVRLPADLNKQVAQEIASGRYSSSEQLIEEAVRRFFDDRQREKRRLATLRRLGQAVDEAGLYERAFTPPE
jgi:Arc/MetJ-type ribon-helix-helix transcriptional regulator